MTFGSSYREVRKNECSRTWGSTVFEFAASCSNQYWAAVIAQSISRLTYSG